MDPTLIVFGIRALVRLSRAGSSAYAQYVRDREILLPRLDYPPFGRIDFVRDMLAEPEERWRILPSGPLADYWDPATNGPHAGMPGAEEALYLAAVQVFAERRAAAERLAPERGAEIAGEALMAQWARGEGPMRPLGRLALVLADVALEYVAAQPSVLRVGGTGEQLVGAMAANLAAMIPDDAGAAGPRGRFAERLVAVFVGAGLDALARHPEAVVGSAPLQQLVRATLPPVIAGLPDDLSEQARWRDVAEALVGPAARAAIGVIAADPAAFVGPGAAGTAAAGAITRAMLEQASELALRHQPGDAAWIALQRAAVAVAAERPGLFSGPAGPERAARALFEHVGAALRAAAPPLDPALAAGVAAEGLRAVVREGPRFLDPGMPWPRTLGAVVTQVVEGLGAGLGAAGPGGPGVAGALSRSQLAAVAGVLVRRAARTPGVASGGRTVLRSVAHGLATLLAADADGLLSPEDWLRVAAAAADAALAGPGRVFDGAGGGAGMLVARALLDAAAAARATGATLPAGDTLRDAVAVALRCAAEVDAPAATREAVGRLLDEVTACVGARRARLGGAAWLQLLRAELPAVLAGGPVPAFDDARIAAALAGSVA